MQNTLNHPARKIKICFVSPKAYPLFNRDIKTVFGGAEVDLYLIATELAKDNHYEISIVVADYGQPEEEVRENVRIVKSIDFEKNPLIGIKSIWKALMKANSDIYMFETASPGVPLVSLFCQLHKKKFVYRTAHVQECNGDYSRKKPLSGFLFTHSLKRADRVLCQNQSDKTDLESNLGIYPTVIPNAYRDDMSCDFEKQSILWVGRSAGFKHPERFLELAKHFPDEHFVMICPQATNDNNYPVLCENANKVDNLRFIERVDFFEIDTYFAQAKVFVSTSDSEGFPNTFIQACKAATAILSYAVNPDGFLDTHRCGAACDFSEAKMIEKLRDMLDSREYAELGRRGRDYAQMHHDIGQIAEQYKTIFKG